jgi:hypothetical protein
MRRLCVRARGILLAVAAFIFIHAMSAGLTAAMSEIPIHYDLDSLVYLSGDIVEGRLVGPSQLRVTAVHAGNLHVGDTVNLDLEIPPTVRMGSNPIADDGAPLLRGDGVFAFFARPRPTSAGRKETALAPLEGGMRFVIHGRVRPFERSTASRFHAAPYFPNIDFTQTVPEFRVALRASIRRVAAWHAQLDRPAEPKDIPWLISLLRERYIPPPPTGYLPWDDDAIADAAADRILELHDLDALDQGLRGNPIASRLLSGFNTADGREFLLSRISEQSTPRAYRLQLARTLGDYWTDGMYASSTRPGRLPDTEDPRTFSYLARVAKLAASESERDEEMALALLHALKCRVGQNQSDRDSRLQADQDDAVRVLRTLYRQKTTSDRIRFRIEEVLAQIGDATYQSLNSKCGPMLTLAEPDDDSKYGVLAVPSLVLQYTLVGIRDSKITSAVLVLEPVSGGVTHAVPSGMIAVGHSNRGTEGGGGDVIALPTGIAPGRYRVYYRLMNGDKIVSEGHGFETEIPVPASVSAAAQANTAKLAWFAAQMTPRPPLQLRTSWINSAGGGSIAIFAALILQAFARGRRARWRMRRGLCPDCGYDLRASTVRCPECGRPVSGDLGAGVVRRRLLGMARAGSILFAVLVIGLWVRSYWAADCLTRTAGRSADALYCTRGAIVYEHSNADDDYGWTYEHDSPTAFPRSVSETVGNGWRVLGFEYSSDASLTVVPCWVVVLATAMLAVLFTRGGKNRRTGKRGSFGFSRTATGTAN